MKKSGLVLALLCCSLFAQAQLIDTLHFVHYNLLQYGHTSCASLNTKNSRLKPIMNFLRPDILTVNEMSPTATAVNSLRDNVLAPWNPAMTATAFGNSSGSDLVNMLYYNADKIGYLGHEAVTGNVRDIDVYRLFARAGTHPGDTLDFYCFVAHFKSSTGDPNVLARAAAAQDVVDWLAAHPAVKRYIISGDFNLYSSTEPAYQTLKQRFADPSGVPNGWQGAAYAHIHTQSPADGSDPCAVTGGMDDRFDFVLTAPDMYNVPGNRLRYAPGTYRAVGNDGNSYNTSLGCNGNNSVPAAVCSVLSVASDHLPVALDFLVNTVTPVHTPAETAGRFRLGGNPAAGTSVQVLCDDPAPGDCRWQLHDAAGMLKAEGLWPAAGSASREIPLGDLPAGVYFISVMTNDGHPAVLRLLRG